MNVTTAAAAPEAATEVLPPELVVFQQTRRAEQVDVAGQRWRIRRSNPGAPVLLALPGALGGGDVFFRTAAALGGRFDVVTVSYPVIDDQVALTRGLAALIDHLSGDPVVVVGSSLGGYLAQCLAMARPDSIRLAVFGNTFRNPTDQQAKWPAADIFAAIPAETVLRDARQRLLASPSATAPQAELRSVLLALVGTEQSAEEVKAQRLTVLRASPLPPVDLPPGRIALIDDDDDPVITPGTRTDMRHTYPHSTQERISFGGHYPSILAPDLYHVALSRVLTQAGC